MSSPVPAVLAPKGKALHRLRASGGPPALTRASRTAPARCPRAGVLETAAEPGKLSASRELRPGKTQKVGAWEGVGLGSCGTLKPMGNTDTLFTI